MVKKLNSKQEELDRRERYILAIKDNTTQILKLLQRNELGATSKERKIQLLNKTKEIEHK